MEDDAVSSSSEGETPVNEGWRDQLDCEPWQFMIESELDFAELQDTKPGRESSPVSQKVSAFAVSPRLLTCLEQIYRSTHLGSVLA